MKKLKCSLKTILFAASLSATALLATSKVWAQTVPSGEWLSWGQNIDNTKNPVGETFLTKDNVKNLKPEWIWEARASVYTFPTIKDNWLYVTDYPLFSPQSIIDPKKDGGWIYAVDRTKGTTIWERRIYDYSGSEGNILSRNSPAIFEDMLVFGDALNSSSFARTFKNAKSSVYGVNRFTGEMIWKTVVDDHYASQITQSPVIHDGVVYVGVSSIELAIPGLLGPLYSCCNFRGSMLALDAKTGAILWKTYTIPDNQGRRDQFSGGSVWGSSPSIDTKRGVVYIATGNNYDAPTPLKDCIKDSKDDAIKEEACYVNFDAPDNYFDSVMALDLKTGAIRWVQKVLRYDAWNFACLLPNPIQLACPKPKGGDYDFGQAPMIIHDALVDGKTKDLVVVGQKTGIFWAFDPDQGGNTVWSTQVGPEGLFGGHEFGSATDGKRIYVQITNLEHKDIPLIAGPHKGETTHGGIWAALDIATGTILWQMPVPASSLPLTGNIDSGKFGKGLGIGFFALAMGPLSVANGVVYAGSLDGYMYAMDAETGNFLWSYKTKGSINSAPSIVDGSLYWGSGYPIGFGDTKLYKFSLPEAFSTPAR